MDTVTVRRDKITSDLRENVLFRDSYTCRYCGSKEGPFHLDHVYPVSKGGETSFHNLVTSCSSCNSKKHTSIMWPKPLGYFKYRKSHFLMVFLSPTTLGVLVSILWLSALSETSDILRSIEFVVGLVCFLPIIYENIKYMLFGEM